jgi:uncharacterized protein YjbI with pentapeptide repeats
VDRWRGPDGEQLAAEVFARLTAGKALDDLALGEFQGRVDLRGLPAPVPTRLQRFESRGRFYEELGGLLRFEGCRLESLDLSGAFLDSLRFLHTRIADCRFDQARCQRWRMWAVDVSDTSFDEADLRNSVLGAWHDGRGDVFRTSSFRKANLREIISDAGTFVDCDFSHAKLIKIDFGSTSFIRCRFAGELREVIFWDHGFETGKPEPNQMEDVDFTEARLREVEFRRLNLDNVKLPASDEHVIVHRYRCVLDRALHALADDPHPNAPALRAFLEVEARWVGPRQEVGVFSRRDLADIADPEYAVELLRRSERECA